MKASVAAFLLALPTAQSVVIRKEKSEGTQLKFDDGNAVTKVAKLLKDIEKQVTEEGEHEKDLFDKFVCWGKGTKKENEEIVAKATARKTMLQARVAELSAASLAMEKKRIQAEQDAVELDLKKAQEQRDSEEGAFKEKQAITASSIEGLNTAVKVLNGDSENAGLLSVTTKHETESEAAVHAKKAQDLSNALTLADEFMSKADATFLRRIFTGKLNLVQMSASDEPYQSRTEKITKQLKEISTGLEAEIKQDEKTESQSQEVYLKLHRTKTDQKQAIEREMRHLQKQSGAREMDKAEAEAEIGTLTEQITAANEMMKETSDKMEAREKEYDEKTNLRNDELVAIGQAQSILTSDAARDTFRASFSFLQVNAAAESTAGMKMAATMRAANNILLNAGKKGQDGRVLYFVRNQMKSMLAEPSKQNFDEVIQKIDGMKNVLKSEEDGELKRREDCISDHQENKEKQVTLVGAEEELATAVSTQENKIAEAKSLLQDNRDQMQHATEELEKAEKLRQEENQAYQKSNQEDFQAKQLLVQATKVLSDFYKDKSSLLQMNSQKAPYNHKKGASNTIVGTLEMLAEDLQKQMDLAKKTEDNSKKAFDDSKASLLAEKERLDAAKTTLQQQKSAAMEARSEKELEQEDKQQEIEVLKSTIAGNKKSCDFFLKHFDKRQDGRNAERDGLTHAKTMLESYQKKSM